MSKILIISSCVHNTLSAEQLNLCLTLVKQAGYDFHIELLQAGVYEIPFVVNTYHKNQPFDGYIALGLILKTNQEHYQYIMNHIQYSFSQFALENIIVGNGIVSGETIEELCERLRSSDKCLSAYSSAFKAVDCLIKFKSKFRK